MNILSKTPSTQTIITGQFSDGSDRKLTTITTWTVEMKDNGHTYQMQFDHEPTDDEIQTAFDSKNYIDITSPIDLLQQQVNDLNIAIAAILGGGTV